MNDDILKVLLGITILFFSVVIHECAHGWVALKRGDPTAQRAGRLTLNPFSHIDLWGTIIIPLILIQVFHFAIGWAKPVPVNFYNLHNPRRDMIWVALAGPGVNILIALAASFGLHGFPEISDFWNYVIIVNLMLAVFNLTPVPPLDGSRIISGILPLRLARLYARMEPYGLFVVAGLFYLGLMNYVLIIVLVLARFLGVRGPV